MSLNKNLFLLATGSGCLLTLAWPTYGFIPLIFIGLLPLLYLEHVIGTDAKGNKKWRVWGYSYLAFLIWNIGTTWWIVNSTVVGMIFANVLNTLFYSFLFLLFHWSKKRLPLRSAYLFLICIWIGFEKFHLIWDLSWPWLNLGNAFSESIHWIQWYEYTGVFGGSLWVLIINIGFFEVIKKYSFKTQKKQILRKSIPLLLGVALPIVFSLFLYVDFETKKPNVNVVLTQPSVDPYNQKYVRTNVDFVSELEELTTGNINDETDYLLTPETYFSGDFGEELRTFNGTRLHKDLQNYLKPYENLQLISGIQFYDIYQGIKPPNTSANQIKEGYWVDFYNSALGEQFDKPHQVYHKSKLVVGVENMPFKAFLIPIIGSVMLDLGGTVASRVIQKERSLIQHATLQTNAAPIICYESIYGEFVTDYVKKGANFLAIISNDAWWKNTEGHRQLLSYSRLRAIENRRDIARSANTGISAIIDAKGNIIKSLEYGKKGLLKGRIAMYDEITFYTRYGDMIARWSFLLGGILLLIAISGRLKND